MNGETFGNFSQILEGVFSYVLHAGRSEASTRTHRHTHARGCDRGGAGRRGPARARGCTPARPQPGSEDVQSVPLGSRSSYVPETRPSYRKRYDFSTSERLATVPRGREQTPRSKPQNRPPTWPPSRPGLRARPGASLQASLCLQTLTLQTSGSTKKCLKKTRDLNVQRNRKPACAAL